MGYAAKANAIAALKVKIDAMKAAEKVELAMEAAAMVAEDLADKADNAAAEAVKENAAPHQQVQAVEAARVANHAEKAMLQAYEASSNVADKAKSAMEAAAKVAIEATENAKRAEEAEAKAEQRVEDAMEEMVEMGELLADKFAGYISKVYDKASAKVTTIVPCGGSKGTCSGDAFSFKEEHGLIRLECSGKDGCNSVDFKCTNPTLCSVTCKDGEPACNSLTVTPGITVICSSEEACNSVKPESSVSFDPVAADAKRTEEMQQFLAAESSANTLRHILAMMQVKELKAEDTTEKAYAAKANAIAALKVKIDAMKAAEKVELAMEAAAMVAEDLADKADNAAAEAVKENAAPHQQVQA